MIEIKNFTFDQVSRDKTDIIYRSPYGVVGTPEYIFKEYFQNKGYSFLWSGSEAWCQLAFVLFFDVIYSDIDIPIQDLVPAHESNIPKIPPDLFSIEFFERRDLLFQDKVAEIRKHGLSTILMKSVNDNKNIPSGILGLHDWSNIIPLEAFRMVCQKIPADIIIQVCLKILRDFSYNRNGIPRLTFISETLLLVQELEVSKPLKPEMLAWHKFFGVILDQAVSLCLINHTATEIAAVDAKYQHEGKTLSMVFSDNGEYAVQAIKDYFRDKPNFHHHPDSHTFQIEFKTGDIENIFQVFERTKDLKTPISCQLDNEPKGELEIKEVLSCYREKQRQAFGPAYCKFHSNDRQTRSFGCRLLHINPLDHVHKPWVTHGEIDKAKGIWTFDRDGLTQIAQSEIKRLSVCPVFSPSPLYEALRNLADRIIPTQDKNWGFVADDGEIWIFDLGKWMTLEGSNKKNKEFPGYAKMKGIAYLSDADRLQTVQASMERLQYQHIIKEKQQIALKQLEIKMQEELKNKKPPLSVWKFLLIALISSLIISVLMFLRE